MKRLNNKLSYALYFVLVAVLMVGCKKERKVLSMPEMENLKQHEIIKIDSCEYIKWYVSYKYSNITHKGNCVNH
jgi:hypothetical protein